jgi:predicted phage-related endonuclease
MPLVEKNINNFNVTDNTVVLTEQYLKKQSFMFKKITGTRLSAVVGLNKYNSPFKTWMIMTNLYRDVMDPTLAKVGSTIEPLVRNHVINQLNCKFKIYDPAKCN